MTYPESPGWREAAIDTSRQAARSFATRAKPIRVRTLEVIERGPASAEQVGEEIGEHFMIVRARCSELKAKGLIEDSGARGDGALGGRVVIWRATSPLQRAIFAASQAAQRG